MGHSSSIALGIAIQKPATKIWCIDGDGAVLMHMGALSVIGAVHPHNLVHVVINNEAHETVGGMPTAVKYTDICEVAKACGYSQAYSVDNENDLDNALEKAKQYIGLCMVEVKCALGAREDLGRPTTSAIDNKKSFMNYISKLSSEGKDI